MSIAVEAVPFLFSAALFGALAWYSFRRPQVPGATWFGWVMATDAWWVLSYAMDLASTDVGSTTFWLYVKYLGSAPNSLLWLSFTLEMTGYQRWLRSAWYRALWALPILLIVIVFTNGWHNWFWTDIHVLPGVADSQTSHGPAYDAYIIVTALIGLASLVLFVRHSLITVPFYRRRNLWLIAALLCPNVGIYFNFGWIHPLFARVDQVLLMLVPASILMSIAIYRYKALDIVPLAQRLVFETINSGVVVVDPEGYVVASNQYASQRWPETTRAGARFQEIIPGTRDHSLEDGAQWEMQQADGTWFLVIVSKVASRREGMLGHALMFVDISERKAAEQARAEAVAARSEFLATVSHELRTPLHGATSLIQLALQTPLDDVQRNYLERAQASSQQLLSIINDVLDQARIEAGQMTFERTAFDLSAIIEQLRSVHSVAAQERQIDFAVVADNLGAPLLGDPLRLAQVLTNLTGNAIKFTHGGRVVVTVTVADDRVDRIKLAFCVADTGVGISSDRLDTLFDPFTQGDSSTTRLFGGTGLGLSISQALVRGMGGEIEVTSQPGKGSTFSFSLWFDVADADAVIASPEDAPVPDLSGYRILVADDTPLNIEIVCALLAETGVALGTAADGEAALVAAMLTRYDVVLMDIHMPKADGFATTRALRANAAYAQVPIIAMTASALREDRELALQAGMVDFLAKPFDRRQLYDVIRRNLPAVPDRPCDAHLPSPIAAEASEFGIDPKTGLSVVGGNLVHYRELLRELTTSARALLDISRRADAAEDHREPAHSLRGAAGMLGAHRLAAVAAAIEFAPEGSADSAVDEALTSRLHDAIVLVERYLQQEDSHRN
jgi:signal transduction histidine kinase/CheY-like chemotaxis protein/HPt (histidine-containing phosphotransfer) domain-containing protein